MSELDAQQSDNRRQRGRLHCEYFYCRDEHRKLGVVLDLSTSGMKMCQKGKLKTQVNDDLKLTFRCGDNDVQIDARVRWIRQIGYRMHMFGLEFLNMTSSRTAEIQNISRIARKALVYD